MLMEIDRGEEVPPRLISGEVVVPVGLQIWSANLVNSLRGRSIRQGDLIW